MTSFTTGAQPQTRSPQSIGFLLLDNFTLISLASCALTVARYGPAMVCRSLRIRPCTRPHRWTR